MHLEELLTHKDIEGYVLHFPGLNHRVKLKTNDYFQKRYMKSLTVERFVDQFVSRGLTGMRVVNDEELYPLIDAIETDLIEYVTKHEINVEEVVRARIRIESGNASRKDVFTNGMYNDLEKLILAGKQINYGQLNKELRERFRANGKFDNLKQTLESFLQKRLDSI
jgi:hypothetical protein